MSSKRLLSIDKIPGTAKKLRNCLSAGLGISDSQDAPQPTILTSNSNNQPSLSHQTSSVIEPALGSVSDTQKLWDADKANSAAWCTLQAALKGLENCSGVFPPLKHAIEGLSQCIREIPETNRRRQEYSDLASDLEVAVDSLTEHVKECQSAKMSNCVLNLINAIHKELWYINKEQQKGFLSRIAKSEQENEQLVRCYRRIEARLRQLEINACLSVWSILHEHIANARLDRLSPAMQARFNSAQSQSIRRRRCNPNTRATVLTDLRVWSLATCSPKLYWMNGMAGTGKTTIAFSFCEALERACQLGASFFCSRLLSNCRDVNKILPTIAYQLADFSYPFRTALCDVLASLRDIASYDLDAQFEILFRKPLLNVQRTIPENIVVVIDALDECFDPSGTKAILDLLFRNATTLPIKFFITSRPEPTINKEMLSQNQHARQILFLHELQQAIVQADIETYLCSELASMSPPPTKGQITQLAQQAGNLFIYAATAVRYICPKGLAVNSHQRLSLMLGMSSSKQSTNKHKELDLLYEDILASALEHQGWEPWEAENISAVLNTVICVKEPTSSAVIASLLGWEDESEVQLALEHLRSVVQISDVTGLISALHASFPEYMFTQQRSGRFFCDQTHYHQSFALRCFDLMRRSLRFNMCGLESSYVFDRDLPDLVERLDRTIAPQLLYACQYWGNHLQQSGKLSELCVMLHEFLLTQLLFWIEVINITGHTDARISTLSRANKWLEDAHNFTRHVANNINPKSTPHIYLSALAFWPKDRPVAKIYKKHFTGIIKPYFRPPTTLPKSVAPNSLIGHTHMVSSLAFSWDGRRIISSCQDNVVCVWDVRTGANVLRTKGSYKWGAPVDIFDQIVPDDGCARLRYGPPSEQKPTSALLAIGVASSVSASSDGYHIATGYRDGTIRIWKEDVANNEKWYMDNQGWVRDGGDSRILFWLPLELYRQLKLPQNTLVLCKDGSFEVELDGLPLGERWQQCYIGPSALLPA